MNPKPTFSTLQRVETRHSVMRFFATAIALAFAVIAPSAASAAPVNIPELNNGLVYTYYAIPKKPADEKADDYKDKLAAYEDHMKIYQTLKTRGVLEELRQFLSPLKLLHPLILVADECGSPTASPHYTTEEWTIHMCYEFLRLVQEIAPKQTTPDGVTPAQATVGLFVGVILHETGHAVFHTMNVPMFGREEDAADQMAALIALQFNKDVAATIIKGFVYFWRVERDFGADPPTKAPDPKSKDYPNGETAAQKNARCMIDPFCAYADEHGTASQRMYNTVCLALGAYPDTFKEFADKIGLPKARADNCANEYKQVVHAFAATLMPYIDKTLMKKVQETDWLMPNELK